MMMMCLRIARFELAGATSCDEPAGIPLYRVPDEHCRACQAVSAPTALLSAMGGLRIFAAAGWVLGTLACNPT